MTFSCDSPEILVYRLPFLPILLLVPNSPIMDNSSIKNNICKIRKERKLTQEDMALQLGISLTAYRDLEKGNTSLLSGHLHRIASLLDTPTEEIVLGYRPSQMESASLKEVQHEYSGKITILERRIADLENLVHSLEETITSKNEIISMLKRMLSQQEG